MTPEERAAALFRRIVSPVTGEFTETRPALHEIVAAIRKAVAEETERCARIAEEFSDPGETSYGPILFGHGRTIASVIRIPHGDRGV